MVLSVVIIIALVVVGIYLTRPSKVELPPDRLMFTIGVPHDEWTEWMLDEIEAKEKRRANDSSRL